MTEKFEALRKGHWLDFSSNKSPKCPHCGNDYDIAENEAWHLYKDDESHDITCQACDIDFRVASLALWSFSTDEQDQD